MLENPKYWGTPKFKADRFSYNMDTPWFIFKLQYNEALKIFVLTKICLKRKAFELLALLYIKAYEASPDFRTRRSVSADYRWIGVWCRESNPSESDGVMYCFIRSAVQVFNKGAGNGT